MSSPTVESAETLAINPPTKKSIKSWFTKKRLIIIALVAAVLAALGIGAAIYAASIPVGTIKVYTYDDTQGQHESLGNVVVTVNSVNSSAECSDSTKKTFPDSDTRKGTVEFYNCKARPYDKPKRKFLKYSIASAVRDGYQIKHGSKFKRNEEGGAINGKGAQFAVRANKTTNVEILMEKVGTPQTAKKKVTPITAVAASSSAPSAAYNTLKQILENPKTSNGVRFGVRDDVGLPMETLKIYPNPKGGYLGVYHQGGEGTRKLYLATSPDLATWTRVKILASDGAGQGTLAQQPDGKFVVIFEREQGNCTYGSEKGNCLNFMRFANIDALLSGPPAETYWAKRQQSVCGTFGGNEGTPNIYSITNNTIDVGFHYFRECKFDREARGTLTDFNSWTSKVETDLNAQFDALSPPREILGDRDGINFQGSNMALLETQAKLGDHNTWNLALYEFSTNHLELLKINIGSKSIANPTMSYITLPGGGPALVVTYYIFGESSADGEAGEAIFYKEL